jgi:hypothetical protein
MENKEHQKQIKKLLSRKVNNFGLCLTDIKKQTGLTKDQIRVTISFLLGARELQEQRIGMSKIYYIPKNNFMGDKD